MAALSDDYDLLAVMPAGLSLLVDCSANDGAYVDSVSAVCAANGAWLIDRPSSLADNARILLYMGDGTNFVFACGRNINESSGVLGQRLDIPLPLLNSPVPNLTSIHPTDGEYYPGEAAKKNTGLLIPAGKQLYAGVSQALTGPSTASRLIISAQGGYY